MTDCSDVSTFLIYVCMLSVRICRICRILRLRYVASRNGTLEAPHSVQLLFVVVPTSYLSVATKKKRSHEGLMSFMFPRSPLLENFLFLSFFFCLIHECPAAMYGDVSVLFRRVSEQSIKSHHPFSFSDRRTMSRAGYASHRKPNADGSSPSQGKSHSGLPNYKLSPR